MFWRPTIRPKFCSWRTCRLARSIPPGADHFLGTTNLGRDIYSQLVIGTRGALIVGGDGRVCRGHRSARVIGLVSGYLGGLIDTLLMRLADIALGIPFLPFVIVLVAFLGPGIVERGAGDRAAVVAEHRAG